MAISVQVTAPGDKAVHAAVSDGSEHTVGAWVTVTILVPDGGTLTLTEVELTDLAPSGG